MKLSSLLSAINVDSFIIQSTSIIVVFFRTCMMMYENFTSWNINISSFAADWIKERCGGEELNFINNLRKQLLTRRMGKWHNKSWGNKHRQSLVTFASQCTMRARAGCLSDHVKLSHPFSPSVARQMTIYSLNFSATQRHQLRSFLWWAHHSRLLSSNWRGRY